MAFLNRLFRVGARWLPLALIVCLVPIYWVQLTRPGWGFFHDDGIYAVTAKALAVGKGYNIVSLPEPIPQTKYPILYPALLAAFISVAGLNPLPIFGLKAISALAVAAWGALCFLLFRRLGVQVTTSLWIALFLVASSVTTWLGVSILPDGLFNALTVASILVLLARSQRSSCVILAGTLAGLAFLTRSLGVAWILAGAIGLFLENRRRDAFLFGIAAIGTSLPWILWQQLQSPPINPDFLYYSKWCYQNGHLLKLQNAEQMLVVLFFNIFWVVCAIPLFFRIPLTLPALVFGIVFWILVFKGLRCQIKAGRSTIIVWFFLYLGLVVIWVFTPLRYLLPLAPLIAYFFVVGATTIGRTWQSTGLRRCIPVLFTLACLCTVIAGQMESLRLSSRSHIVPWGQDADSWPAFLRSVEWIRHNSPPDAIVASGFDPVVHQLIGRRSIRLSSYDPYLLNYDRKAPLGTATGGPKALKELLDRNRVAYALISPMAELTEAQHVARNFRVLVVSCPEAFKMVYHDREPGFAVFQVNAPQLKQCVPVDSLGLTSMPRPSQLQPAVPFGSPTPTRLSQSTRPASAPRVSVPHPRS
jgi:hypothetical protein